MHRQETEAAEVARLLVFVRAEARAGATAPSANGPHVALPKPQVPGLRPAGRGPLLLARCLAGTAEVMQGGNATSEGLSLPG